MKNCFLLCIFFLFTSSVVKALDISLEDAKGIAIDYMHVTCDNYEVIETNILDYSKRTISKPSKYIFTSGLGVGEDNDVIVIYEYPSAYKVAYFCPENIDNKKQNDENEKTKPKTTKVATKINTSTFKENKIKFPETISDNSKIQSLGVAKKSSIKDYYYILNGSGKCLYAGNDLGFRSCKSKDRYLWKIKIVNIHGGGLSWSKTFFSGGIIVEISNKEKNKCLVYNKNDSFKTSMECSRPALFEVKGDPITSLCKPKANKLSSEERRFCHCSSKFKSLRPLDEQQNCLEKILSSRGEGKKSDQKTEVNIAKNKTKIHKYIKLVEPKYYTPWMDQCDEWTQECYPEEGQLFGPSWTTEQDRGGGIKRKAAEKVIYRFITKKKTLGKYPHLTIKGIAYLEILYNQLIFDRAYDKKLLNDLRNAVISFRNSFNFSKDLSVNEAVARYWVLAYLTEHGKTKKNKVSKDLLERKGALQSLKKSILMVRSFIDFDTSSTKNNKGVTIIEEKKFSSLRKEFLKIINSFESYHSDIKKPKSTLAKNIDNAMKEHEKLVNNIFQNLNKFSETNNEESLIAATYGMDLLNNILNDTISKIPNEYNLDMGAINNTYKKLHSNTIKNLINDTNNNKIQTYKNNLIYIQKLDEFDFSSIDMLEKLNDLDLGLDNIDKSINNLNLASLNSAQLDIENINSSIDELNNIDVQEISSTIEQSTKAVEEAVEEAAQSIFEMVTLRDVMDVIHEEVKGHTWFELPTLEEYLELRGVTGIVDSTTSFSDAVELFNQDTGINFTEEDVLMMMAADVCQSAGMCTHPDYGFPSTEQVQQFQEYIEERRN